MQNSSAFKLGSQPTTTGSVIEPAQPVMYDPVTGQPIPIPPLPKKKVSGNVIETIILILTAIIAVTFIVLFVMKYLEWDAIKTNIDGQIDAAVAMAVAENSAELEAEFAEREKNPYKDFLGPADYGSLSFQYPRTWSVYIARDAARGGNYEAYMNPSEVLPVSSSTINALRVQILDQPFETVAQSYNSSVSSGNLTITTRNVGNTVANVYTGVFENNLRGILTIFKVRDKTVYLRTDAMLFADEYYKLLDTVAFVE